MFEFFDDGFDSAPVGEQSPQGHYIPDAAECARCGQCVSACSTFKLFQVDAQTPRQRLRSISKVLVHDATLTSDEREALNACLQCRACEPRCPSQVAYGALFDEVQARLQADAKQGVWARIGFKLIERKHWLQRLLPLIALYQRLGLSKPLRASGVLHWLGLAQAESLTTTPALQPLAACYPVRGDKRGRVALFTGCLAESFDRDTQTAAITVLNALGYEVIVPPEQACCGAIHQHNGLSAAGFIAHNQAVFAALAVEAVLFSATGCGAMLADYPPGVVFQDVQTFVLQHWRDDLALANSNLKVAVHEPCSGRNVLKNMADTYALLAKIPGLALVPLANNGVCCGAGGSYMLTHPENAQSLRALTCQAITEADVDSVVSSNFGCGLFLNAGLQEIKVVHPLVILTQYLSDQ